jgi:type I protein arginine methyltransferase
VKLVNYIRSEVKAGNHKPNVSSKDKFSDDKYLQPVLEDDALLFTIDEILESDTTPKHTVNMDSISKQELFDKVSGLTEHVERVEKEFAAYKEIAEKTLDQRWNAEGEGGNPPRAQLTDEQQEGEKGYFNSYSFTGTLRNYVASVLNFESD